MDKEKIPLQSGKGKTTRGLEVNRLAFTNLVPVTFC